MPRVDEPSLAVGYARPVPGDRHVNAPTLGSLNAVSPAANMASNVEDLAKYVAFHLSSNASQSVLKGTTLREMHRPQWLLDDWQNAWGFGVRVRRIDGRVQVGHPGNVPGYRTQIELVPSLRLGAIVLTNADDGNPAQLYRLRSDASQPIAAKAIRVPSRHCLRMLRVMLVGTDQRMEPRLCSSLCSTGNCRSWLLMRPIRIRRASFWNPHQIHEFCNAFTRHVRLRRVR